MPWVTPIRKRRGGDLSERQRAAIRGSTDREFVTTRIERRDQIGLNDLQVLDALLNLTKFDPGTSLQPVLDPLPVPVLTHHQQLGNLIQGETQPSAALMIRNAVTASCAYNRCPPGLRSGSANNPIRS